ncbi:MAG TPA: hypothetical protein VJ022_01990 [Anaerolineales bacterium]|nr:hypothetical protein [Anaerolineales bacterium]
MKKIALLFVIASAMILATACANAPAATPAPVQPTATEAPVEPTVTDAVPESANGTQVDITLADNTIEASLSAFQVGIPYTFVITNTGPHAHNFNISTPVAVAGSLKDALATALLAVDQDQLGAGDSVTVDYTFPVSAAGADLELSCLIRRHYDDGMFLPITVTE